MGLDFYHTYFDLPSFPLQLDWNIMDNDKKMRNPLVYPPLLTSLPLHAFSVHVFTRHSDALFCSTFRHVI